jgi:tetratricopeptide (TPR) repeat protein
MIKLFLLLFILLSVLNGSNKDSTKLTEHRLNQIEKELVKIQKENQKLIINNTNLINTVADLKNQNTQQYKFYQNTIELNEKTHNNVLDKIFWFTTIFTGFWVFLIAIVGWMLKSPFISWLNNKIEKQIEYKVEEDGIKKLLQDTKQQIVEEATKEMGEKLKEYEKQFEEHAEQIRKLEEFRSKDFKQMTDQQKREFESIVEELRGKKDKSDKEWFYIGLEEQNKSQNEEAIKAYEIAVKKGFSDIALHNNLAIAYMENNEVDKAEENYKKSIALKSSNFKAYGNLLELQLIKNNEFEKSIVDAVIENFSLKEEHYLKYLMLDILREIKHGVFSKEKILTWAEDNKSLSLDVWYFDDLSKWIDTEENEVIKNNLLYALSIFKEHKNN